MDVGRLFSRSIELLWKFKFLLLFGIVMGLTGGGLQFNYSFNRNSFADSPFRNGFSLEPGVLVIGLCFFLVLVLVWLILFFYFRFVARGALVAAVRDVETQQTPTLRTAWGEGRTFYTRLLGLGFLVNVPLILVSILLVGLALVPALSLILSTRGRVESPTALFSALGIASILGICCAILFIVALSLVVHPLYEFAVRAIVVEDVGVREGLRRGVGQVRAHPGNVLLTYLLLIGARLGWGLVSAIVALPALFISLLAMGGALSIDVNALVILLVILAVPLWLLIGAVEGIFQTFESNVWTEAYLALAETTS
jgi:hypothetical protein